MAAATVASAVSGAALLLTFSIAFNVKMPTVAFAEGGSPGVGSLGKLFDSQAPIYAQFRPSYPKSVYDEIYKFSGLPKKGLAVDVGECRQKGCCMTWPRAGNQR